MGDPCVTAHPPLTAAQNGCDNTMETGWKTGIPQHSLPSWALYFTYSISFCSVTTSRTEWITTQEANTLTYKAFRCCDITTSHLAHCFNYTHLHHNSWVLLPVPPKKHCTLNTEDIVRHRGTELMQVTPVPGSSSYKTGWIYMPIYHWHQTLPGSVNQYPTSKYFSTTTTWKFYRQA